MIVWLAGLVGACYGGWLGWKRKGNKFDIAQYAAGFAIAFSIVGLFAAIFLNRLV